MTDTLAITTVDPSAFTLECNHRHCHDEATAALSTACRCTSRVYCPHHAELIYAAISNCAPLWCPGCQRYVTAFLLEPLS